MLYSLFFSVCATFRSFTMNGKKIQCYFADIEVFKSKCEEYCKGLNSVIAHHGIQGISLPISNLCCVLLETITEVWSLTPKRQKCKHRSRHVQSHHLHIMVHINVEFTVSNLSEKNSDTFFIHQNALICIKKDRGHTQALTREKHSIRDESKDVLLVSWTVGSF